MVALEGQDCEPGKVPQRWWDGSSDAVVVEFEGS